MRTCASCCFRGLGVAVLSLGFAAFGVWSIPAQAQGGAAPAVKIAEPLPPIPAASAVLIVDSPEGVPGADSEALLQRRVNTHIATLRSEQNIRRMLSNANSETRKTSWFTTANNPRERSVWLRDHLRAAQVSGTPLIEVSLPDVADAGDRKIILREVCDQYLQNEKQQQSNRLLDRTQMLNTVKLKIDMRLKQITDDMRAKQIQLNINGGGIGRMGVKEIELSKLVSEQIEAQIRAQKVKGSFETLTAAAQQGQSFPALDAVVRSDVRIQELQRRLDDAGLRLAIIKAKSNDKSADALEVGVETDYLQKKIEARSGEIAARAKVSLVEEAKSSATAAQAVSDGLRQRVEKLKEELGDLGNSTVAYLTLQEEHRGLREQRKDVMQQIEQVMALQASNSVVGVRWHIQPEAAE